MKKEVYMHKDAQIWEGLVSLLDNDTKNEKFISDLSKLQKQMMEQRCEKVTPESHK